MKICKTCEEKLNDSAFYVRGGALHSDCKGCYKEKRNLRYTKEDKVLSSEKRKAKYQIDKKDPGKIELSRKRSREYYQKQKEINAKHWADYEARKKKEINDLL